MHDDMTKDPAYEVVDPNDFLSMVAADRYGRRTTAFDKIIAANQNHNWDPLDPRTIDYSMPFDLEHHYILDPERNLDLQTAIAEKLDEGQRIRLVNADVHWSFSSILHGEQAALSLSARLCHIFKDPGAQEYAANQVREEARHVTAFTKYIEARWGAPVTVGPVLFDLLDDIVSTKLVWKKIVGMQIMVESLAMGAFGLFHRYGRDPVMVRLTQLVMMDEAFHLKFGKMWADRTIAKLSDEHRHKIEDWSLNVFHTLVLNLAAPAQKKHLYGHIGIDWRWAQSAFEEAFTSEKIRQQFGGSTNVIRILVKTLFEAGIITERTAPLYAPFVDIAEIKREQHAINQVVPTTKAFNEERNSLRHRREFGATQPEMLPV